MPSTLAERLAAQAQLARQADAVASGDIAWTQPRADILSSWTRCTSSGLDLARPPEIQVVSTAELARRRDELDFVRRLALAELETLQHQIAGSNFLLAFADREGVILDLYADQRFAMSGKGDDIRVGSCWSEAARGTNGLGTALASGRTIAVTGPEHYFLDLRHVSCTASPVRDASGAVVGVLDASSYFDSRQRHTQALVQMSASQIENRLLMHQMRSDWVLAIHPRPEFLGTLSAGLLAFDASGQLRAANERARAQLSGLTLDTQTRFEELFREPFEHVLGRLRRQAVGTELRLCDALGSVLHARCVSDPASATPTTRVATPRSSRAGQTTIDAVRPAGQLRGISLPHGAAATPATTQLATPPQLAPTRRLGRLASTHEHLRDFVIDDAQVQEALELVGAAVRLQAPILIRGESGSGKEMLARHAHAVSGRRGEFVAVNCAALPAELFEAELFGYVGGAYTGARREGDVGLIVSADGGTLLLDEIRELSPTAQAALLRFLDDQQVRPVGGHNLRKVDVQLLAATHADLEAEVAARRFRADLFYRLHTVAVTLPPLRQRSDLAAVVDLMLLRLDRHASISAAALARLRQERWPGNFRELRAVLTRALLRCDDRHIELHDLERVLGPALSSASLANNMADGRAGQITTRSHHLRHTPRESSQPRRAASLFKSPALPPATPAGAQSPVSSSPSSSLCLAGTAAASGDAASPSRSSSTPSSLSAPMPTPMSALQLGATSAVLDEYTRNGGSVSQTSRTLGISRTTVYRHLRLAGAT